MDILNKKSNQERIGNIKKSVTLSHLTEVEKYYLKVVKNYKIETAYDVIANELPYFKTLNYTEWAHCFMIHPLQQELRMKQMIDAYYDNVEEKIDFISFFADKIKKGTSNKYEHIISKNGSIKPRENLVVLVGSNKLKDRICLNKLKWIKDKFDETVYYKPHPLTTYQLVGELKDIFGDSAVLDRDEDMYAYLLEAETVFTSHMSESAIYAVALNKTIEPIDVYHKVEQGSFYHINHFLFDSENPAKWANKTFNSYKSGIINPLLDENWKEKIDNYLEYIMNVREKYKFKYVQSK